MIIDRNLAKFIIFEEERVVDALQKITDNKARAVFSVTESGRIQGILTDGDFRRWLTSREQVDLSVSVREVANQNFLSLPIETPPAEIRTHLTDRIQLVPLIDGNDHLIAVARLARDVVTIAEHEIGGHEPAFLIAEVGNNHNGDPELARRLIDASIEAGADCVKFQMRNLDMLYANAGDADDPSQDLGSQYTLDLLSRFNLPPETLYELFDYTTAKGAIPLCTPWDIESAEALRAYGIEAYKIASADLTNHELLRRIAQWGKPIILSTGMSREAEIAETVRLLQGEGADFVLLHCNSTYPAPFKDVNLRYLERLRKIGNGIVGYSGHERGYHIPIAAVAMGAKVVEKHITLDRDMEGNDHKVSLLPHEFSAMVKAIRDLEEAIGDEGNRTLSQGEVINRETLAKSLVAADDIAEGQTITADMVTVRGPGNGVQPNRLDELIGSTARRAIRAGGFFYPSDLGAVSYQPKAFRFRRPWGIPVRYHDVADMLDLVAPDFVEYHLSYKDMELDLNELFDGPLDIGFVVHSPELFQGDHVMDLSARDREYRQRSIDELQHVIDITRRLADFHRTDGPTKIVANVGGFSVERPLAKEERRPMYEMIANGLDRVDDEGVEVLPQTMPPFPWHFGGQRHHNLFVDKDEIRSFCETYGTRVCLDVSHSKLACNHAGTSFDALIEEIAPFAAHLHIVDASGVDGEGLQIGDGEIDFAGLAKRLDEGAPGVGFIPEIWQGHKNIGEGFWRALSLLERWF